VGITVQPESRARSSSDVHVPRLREQRLKRALSQQELAKLSGISRTTIIKLEAGRDAWPQTVRKLARALRVDPSALQS
jgi:transcriptional regulator with XRE-family HTH domain